ncbi:uncharacterized protein PAC_18825 [Phialocephala subalpina]|uniref:Uncharacterized protein n=1 Tax=Phialocephala subalpina TaxID=576137 RepID=A0A1L7XV51_9HELO|nr:uncharacterized protein PAC_18825 [Phialocephala subalpina]
MQLWIQGGNLLDITNTSSLYESKEIKMLSFFFFTWYTLGFSALASATSAPEAEETYIECGTAAGSTLKLANVDDVNCVTLQQLVEPYAGKVFSHALQDDGSWLTTVSNTTIEEAEADSQLSVQRTNEELDDLTVLDIPCRTHVETWFTTNNWGYWSNTWKQIGGCYHCKDCNYAASSSASVTQSVLEQTSTSQSAHHSDILGAKPKRSRIPSPATGRTKAMDAIPSGSSP